MGFIQPLSELNCEKLEEFHIILNLKETILPNQTYKTLFRARVNLRLTLSILLSYCSLFKKKICLIQCQADQTSPTFDNIQSLQSFSFLCTKDRFHPHTRSDKSPYPNVSSTLFLTHRSHQAQILLHDLQVLTQTQFTSHHTSAASCPSDSLAPVQSLIEHLQPLQQQRGKKQKNTAGITKPINFSSPYSQLCYHTQCSGHFSNIQAGMRKNNRTMCRCSAPAKEILSRCEL